MCAKIWFFYTWQMGLSAENSPMEQCACFVSSRKIDHRHSLCKNHNNNNNSLWIWELGLLRNHQPGYMLEKVMIN